MAIELVWKRVQGEAPHSLYARRPGGRESYLGLLHFMPLREAKTDNPEWWEDREPIVIEEADPAHCRFEVAPGAGDGLHEWNIKAGGHALPNDLDEAKAQVEQIVGIYAVGRRNGESFRLPPPRPHGPPPAAHREVS